MKSAVKKKAFLVSLGLIFMIFLVSFARVDRVSSQGTVQGGQTLGLGSMGGLGLLGYGGMMATLGYNVTGAGIGMGALNPLSMVSSMGITGSASMLNAGLGMTSAGLYGGSGGMFGGYGLYGGMFGGYGLYGGMFGAYGLYGGMFGGYGLYGGMFGGYGLYGGMFGGYGLYGGMFGGYGLYGGVSPYASIMAIPGEGFFNSSIPPEAQRTSAENIATALANAMVPYFWGIGGSVVTSPIPPTISLHIDVIGFVYEDNTLMPIQGVKVASKYSTTGYYVKTASNGRFLIELFPSTYTLVFSKEGYQNEVMNVNVYSGMGILTVLMEKETLNREPALDIPSSMGVVVGEEIKLDPNTFASDPDGDQLTVTYSGWKADLLEAGYITKEEDIGIHEVEITVSDGEYSIDKTLYIDIYDLYEMVLYHGFNLISYPFENGDSNFSAFDLMEELGGATKIDSIMFYDNNTDRYITASYDLTGQAIGVDFPIKIGQGYGIYAKEDIDKIVFDRYNKGEQSIELIDLFEGMNLVGIVSAPGVNTSYDLLLKLEEKDVESIYRYDSFWGEWEYTYWLNGSPAGDIFPILKGEGYHLQKKSN